MVESQGRTEFVQDEHTFTLTGPAKVSGRNGAMVRFRLAVPGAEERAVAERSK